MSWLDDLTAEERAYWDAKPQSEKERWNSCIVPESRASSFRSELLHKMNFERQVCAIQKEFEDQRAKLESKIIKLNTAHAEWSALGEGPKMLRLKVVADFRKQGQFETVYSEAVKSVAAKIYAKASLDADEAMKRLHELLGKKEVQEKEN